MSILCWKKLELSKNRNYSQVCFLKYLKKKKYIYIKKTNKIFLISKKVHHSTFKSIKTDTFISEG